MRFLLLLAALLIAGCMGEGQPYGNKTAEQNKTAPPAPGVPSIITQRPVETVSEGQITVVRINAEKTAGRWRFPLENHTDEFIAVGFHSDSFIKLDGSHIPFLDENEAIWLTPMLKDGKGILFNAIYTNEIQQCSFSSLKVLGKGYGLAQLGNGTAFGFDEKWKIAHEYEGNCLERVIIYMDGAYYNLSNDDQVSIFRNDNTILFRFMDLEGGPRAEIIATKPA